MNVLEAMHGPIINEDGGTVPYIFRAVQIVVQSRIVHTLRNEHDSVGWRQNKAHQGGSRRVC